MSELRCPIPSCGWAPDPLLVDPIYLYDTGALTPGTAALAARDAATQRLWHVHQSHGVVELVAETDRLREHLVRAEGELAMRREAMAWQVQHEA